MPTLHVEAEVSGEDLLRAVEQLGPSEFERFLARVLALRAQREAPSLTAPEASLIQIVNEGLPAELRQRYDALIARREVQALTSEEHDELLRLTDEVEAIQARRMAALAELARRRGVTLPALMTELGITAPSHG